MNLAHNLFLLATQLVNLRSRDRLIDLFTGSLSEIFPVLTFTWHTDISPEGSQNLQVCTRIKTFGYISIEGTTVLNEESFMLLQNAAQLLALAMEKLEQDQFISDQKLHLQHLVAEKTEELSALNEEYLAINEELVDLNNQLKESELRYRTISRLSADFSYSCVHENESLRVDWITDAFFAITGYSNADLERHGCWLFAAHPDDRDPMIQKITNLKIGDVARDEFRLISKTGKIQTINSTIECVADHSSSNGKRFFGSVVDITGRRQAEEAIQNKANELVRFNNLMIGREVKMVELKKEVNDLLVRIGEDGKYKIQDTDSNQ